MWMKNTDISRAASGSSLSVGALPRELRGGSGDAARDILHRDAAWVAVHVEEDAPTARLTAGGDRVVPKSFIPKVR